jgi:hypothetical protein
VTPPSRAERIVGGRGGDGVVEQVDVGAVDRR